MTADLSSFRLLLVTLSGWINRNQQQVVEYLMEQNRVLREQLKGQRLRVNDDQRRLLAAKGWVDGSWGVSPRSSRRTRSCAGIGV